MLPYKNVQARPRISKVLADFARVSLSQFGEDIVLGEYLLQGRLSTKARYIDLGCFHPLKWSNTALLHFIGWRGLNIDANAEMIQNFHIQRPEDRSVCAGIASAEGMFDFYHIGVGASSTIDVAHKDHRQSKGAPVHRKTELSCFPIMQLLTSNISAEELKQCEYIDIDLEGLDEIVVEQIDWSWLTVKLVTVEIHVQTVPEVLDSKIYKVLTAQGFRLEHYVQATAFFYRDQSAEQL